jgi:hypothetical protein
MTAVVRHSLALALLGCVGCLPDPEPIRWDPVDMDGLRDGLANPTAAVTEQSVAEAADQVIAARPAYVVLASFIAATFLTETGDANGNWLIPRALEGTSVYALLACPGQDPHAIGSFVHGYIRLDSPSLTQELIESRSFGGDLQLRFVDCVVGQFSFAGAIPAHLDQERFELGLGIDEAEYRDLLTGETGQLGTPTLLEVDRSKQLLTLASGETLTLIWQPFALTLELLGSNGSLVCEVIDDAFVCAPP